MSIAKNIINPTVPCLLSKSSVNVPCLLSKSSVNVPCLLSKSSVNVPCLLSKSSVKVPCLLSKSSVKVYIVDFFNIFSDFREIKYKRQNIDFHSIKHITKNQDTYDFFKLFFTRYISYTGIKPDSKFYFIMKGLNDYDVVLDNIIKTHNMFDMKFVIIPDKFKNKILDKNKDDFLCQYFFYMFQKTNPCMLISNDKYRDSETYIRLFNFDLWIKVVSYNKVTNALDKTVLKINPCDFIRTDIKNSLFSLKRCAIPKKNLNKILD